MASRRHVPSSSSRNDVFVPVAVTRDVAVESNKASPTTTITKKSSSSAILRRTGLTCLCLLGAYFQLHLLLALQLQLHLEPFTIFAGDGISRATSIETGSSSSSSSSSSILRENYANPKVVVPTGRTISWSLQAVAEDEISTYSEVFNRGVYRCYSDEPRADLEPSLKSKLWFRTLLHTDLNILVMGDSVAMQLAQLLQEAMSIPNRKTHRALLRPLYPQCTGPIHKRADDCEPEDEKHESLFWGISVSDGGGGSGGWRILDFWLRRNEGEPLPEEAGGGWVAKDSQQLLQTIEHYQKQQQQQQQQLQTIHNKTTTNNNTNNNANNVDVLVFRISQPWMWWQDMTMTKMHKTIEVAREQLGVRVVVFVTIPYSNNIVDQNHIHLMHKKNEMVRRFVQMYPHSSAKLPDTTVLYWDLAKLNNALVQDNARQLRYHVEDDEHDFDFSLETLRPRIKRGRTKPTHTRSIGHVCAPPRVPANATQCVNFNKITYDGQHLCLSTIGGRAMAGLACVIRCAYSMDQNTPLMHACQDACNEQYMSLEEIDPSYFVDVASD